MANLHAAFSRGLILAGKAIRHVSLVARIVTRLDFKVARVFGILLVLLVGVASSPVYATGTNPAIFYWAYGSSLANTLPPSGDGWRTGYWIPTWGYSDMYFSPSSCSYQGQHLSINCAAGCGGYAVCNANYICPAGYTGPDAANMCVSICPAHASGTPCVCDAGYEFDATRTSCVSTCTVTTKVADITDPVALQYEDGTYSDTEPDLEHLTPATQAGLTCIQQRVAALRQYETPQPTSGYRPTAYQKHILEVYDKWQLIKNDNTPACAEVKAAIYAEWLHHKPFARRPGVTSNHSHVDAQGNPAGNAVDISFVPQDIADTIACQCNMYRPMINMPNPKDNDPVHYQPRTCTH